MRLISERGTTDISVTDLAAAADMSRQGIYGLFDHRDSLFVAAGVDLIERELFPELVRATSRRQAILLTVRHLANHRALYRALATGACAYPTKQAVLGSVRSWPDSPLAHSSDMLTAFIVGGMFEVFTRWMVDGADDLDTITDEILGLTASFRPPSAADRNHP